MVKFYCKLSVCCLLAACAIQSMLAEKLTTSIIAAVLRHNDKNVIFSPILLTDGLWQLYLGAEGGTADKISKVLQLDGKIKNESIEEYSNWRQTLNSLENVKLNFANGLFLASDINLLPDYQQQVIEIFQSLPQTVDFANSSSTSTLINNWVANETNDTITKLIDHTDGGVQAMVLSAIYFKGSWKYPFDRLLTRKEDFQIPQKTGGTRTVPVDMMSRKGRHRLNLIDKLDAMSLELPYENSNFSMVILLPRSIDGIAKIVENLNQMDINEIAPKSYEMQVKIYLPKFKFDVNLELKNALRSLGLIDIFHKANFSAMFDSKGDFQIDEFLQRAVIEVNEEGSTDAPEIRFSYINFPMVEIEVRMDHPFVFLIKDDDVVYLAGRVTMD